MGMPKGRFRIFNSLSDLTKAFQEKPLRTLRIGERKLCLAHSNGKFYAFEALCPHQKHPLVTSSLNGFDELICPLHFYRFNLETGQEASRLCRDLITFPIEETDDGIFIKLY